MRKLFLSLFLLMLSLVSYAQYNIDRILVAGRIALDYKDYVLAIQHFNICVNYKPYLYEPWYYRGIAKFYLDDFTGAENDETEALNLNPYIADIWNLRALSRIRQDKFQSAMYDYNQAIARDPNNQGYWFNKAYCTVKMKDYTSAHRQLDSLVSRWPKMTEAYSLQTEVYLTQNDTAQAAKWLDETLKLDPYNGDGWAIKGRLYFARHGYDVAFDAFTNAIHYEPKVVNNYVYRAMVSVNLNKLRQAMDDYDKAVEMDPNNFIAHYNRGLLRLTLGDDNRAIEDFDFVLRLEPNNLQALYNRALLNDKVGNLRAAVRDYTLVIDKFPNFWNGILARANCYRRLGMKNKAELDEFRVFKAQMNKTLGVQPRWSRAKLKQVRRMSDVDLSKYDQLVIDDDAIVTKQNEYGNSYRGEVQNREVKDDFLPMFSLSYMKYKNGVKSYELEDNDLDRYNQTKNPLQHVFITCIPQAMDAGQSSAIMNTVMVLNEKISSSRDIRTAGDYLLQRAVAQSTIHNYEEAINDLDDYINMDSTNVLAFWQRAACLAEMESYNRSEGKSTSMYVTRLADDLSQALSMRKDNFYLLYNQGCAYAAIKDYHRAIDYFTDALRVNPNLAEAFYNRGIAEIKTGDISSAVKDLSRAGELGLYDAYSLMKAATEKANKLPKRK